MSSAAQRIAKEAAAKRQREEEAKLEAAETTEEALDEPEVDSDTPTVEEAVQDGPEALLTSLVDGPTLEQIAEWRERYTSIYALSLRDDDWYVWRYLELGEWRDIQSGLAAVDPEKVEEWIQTQVLARCIVWPRENILDPVKADKQPAGLKNLLYEVIMAGSYFMPTEQALRQTLRL